MSRYKRIQVQMNDRTCLIAALKALGIPYEEGTRLTLYGYHGDQRPETAQIVVRRAHIEPYANDLGFVQTNTGFEVVISEYDSTSKAAMMLKQIQQQYAVAKVTKEAKAKGYTVVPQKTGDGTIRLQLRRY